MDTLVATIEKGKPFFDKVARNKYLKAVRDGFISAMPIVIFSSIFLLIAYVPNIWGFTWPDNVQAMLMKPYSYSMGILALVVAATTAKHFTDSLNRDMPQNNQISFISTMIACDNQWLGGVKTIDHYGVVMVVRSQDGQIIGLLRPA